MNVANCLNIVLAISKYIDVFREIFSGGGGLGDWVTWEDLSIEEFFME